MVRWFLFGIAATFCALSSLTAIKAPTLPAWKGAILISEFGHWFWVVPLLIALLAQRQINRGASPGIGYTTLVLSALSFALLIKPVVQAKRIAGGLPEQLAAAFGPAELEGAPFALGRLFFSPRPTLEAVETQRVPPDGTSPALSFDFYRARSRNTSPAPLVVVIHGGGWDGGNRKQFESFSATMAGWGYAVAAVEYRLAPAHRWPSQRDDVVRTIEFIRTSSQRLAIDPNQIVLFGRSAGGHIAEAVAFGAPPPWLRGLISFYAPADLNFAWNDTFEADLLDSKKLMRQLIGGTPEEAQERFDAASPYLGVKGRMVPTLLAHGQNDALVWHRQSSRLAERLQASDTPVFFLDLPWATHGFDFNPNGPAGQLAAYSVRWFLNRVTTDGVAPTQTHDVE